MAAFPILKTGAYAQYPAERRTQFSNVVLRFLDGSEQKYRNFATGRREWTLHLELLNEQEVMALQQFFSQQQGTAQLFAFTDPWDGTIYPSCRLKGDSFEAMMDNETPERRNDHGQRGTAVNAYFPQLQTGSMTQFPVKRTQRLRSITNELEDGTSIVLADSGANTLEWELNFDGISDAEADALRSFFEAMEGSSGYVLFCRSRRQFVGMERSIAESGMGEREPFGRAGASGRSVRR